MTTENQPGDLAAGSAADNERELLQEIEQTRGRLGETVEELAAKADVKARAEAKVADLQARLQSKAADAAASPAWQAVPEPVRHGIANVAASTRRRAVPVVACVAVLILGVAMVRRWRRR
jgi:Protein of unknown function (DUF3618)